MNAPTRIELVTQEKPVNWLAPLQLIKTALQANTAGQVGTMADPRLVHAALSPEASYIPTLRTLSPKPMWVDYVADTGDGWNATYTVAHTIAQDAIQVDGIGELPRADLLILGGDQVYPTPADSTYRTRFLDPFRSAFPAPLDEKSSSSDPILLALPGNHDWYDGLHGFTQLFCSRKPIGRWRTLQKRSYWAAKLPHGWWIWGLDLQLESQMDSPQRRYFEEIAQQLDPGDRVVLCTPEPSWIDENVQLRQCVHKDDNSQDSNTEKHVPLDSIERLSPRFMGLRDIERLILWETPNQRRENVGIAAVLAGDEHHYAHYKPRDDTTDCTKKAPERITCGGGGAYLLGTHNLRETLKFRAGSGCETYQLHQSFPSKTESKKLRNQIWHEPILNWRFSALLGTIHGLWLLWMATSCVMAFFWGSLVVIGAALFTQGSAPSHHKWRSLFAGGLHGGLHLLLPLALPSLIGSFNSWHPFEKTLAGFAEGWLLGGLTFGLWLMLTNRWAGWHGEEVFSAQAIPDWRSFLRMRIDAEGLTIYPLGIRRSCRRWSVAAGIEVLRQAGSTWRLRATHTASGSRFNPVDPIQVEHIEKPIVIPRTSR